MLSILCIHLSPFYFISNQFHSIPNPKKTSSILFQHLQRNAILHQFFTSISIQTNYIPLHQTSLQTPFYSTSRLNLSRLRIFVSPPTSLFNLFPAIFCKLQPSPVNINLIIVISNYPCKYFQFTTVFLKSLSGQL